MDNNGTNNLLHVNVQQDMNGLDYSARKLITVQQIEYGMKQFKHVYVLLLKFGMEENVQFNLNVVVEEYGI